MDIINNQANEYDNNNRNNIELEEAMTSPPPEVILIDTQQQQQGKKEERIRPQQEEFSWEKLVNEVQTTANDNPADDQRIKGKNIESFHDEEIPIGISSSVSYSSSSSSYDEDGRRKRRISIYDNCAPSTTKQQSEKCISIYDVAKDLSADDEDGSQFHDSDEDLIEEDEGAYFTFDIHGVKLKNVDGLLGKSDPFFEVLRIVHGDVDGPKWKVVYTSEVIYDNLNPKWKTVSLSLYDLCGDEFTGIDRDQRIIIAVKDYEDKDGELHESMGLVETSVNDLLYKKKTFGSFELKKKGKNYGSLKVVSAEIEGEVVSPFLLELHGKKLKNVDGLLGRSDPFYEVSKKTDDGGGWEAVYRSQVFDDDLNPKWKPVTLSLKELCGDDMNLRKPILLSVTDYDEDGTHDPMGSVETSVHGLLQKIKISGCLTLTLPSSGNKKKDKVMGQLQVVRATIDEQEIMDFANNKEDSDEDDSQKDGDDDEENKKSLLSAITNNPNICWCNSALDYGAVGLLILIAIITLIMGVSHLPNWIDDAINNKDFGLSGGNKTNDYYKEITNSPSPTIHIDPIFYAPVLGGDVSMIEINATDPINNNDNTAIDGYENNNNSESSSSPPPTNPPTIWYTKMPTISPTSSWNPTDIPSSKKPTTILPTIWYTKMPTIQPTISLSLSPTTAFLATITSDAPSTKPTNPPTIWYTKMPTIHPTTTSSMNPSDRPSHQPTKEPSYQPSFIPSIGPSSTTTTPVTTTIPPTTYAPSVISSSLPSNVPPAAMTVAPVTDLPVALSSSSPTISPTISVTTTTTSVPTVVPTVVTTNDESDIDNNGEIVLFDTLHDFLEEFEDEEFYVVKIMELRDVALYDSPRNNNNNDENSSTYTLSGIDAFRLYLDYFKKEILPIINAQIVMEFEFSSEEEITTTTNTNTKIGIIIRYDTAFEYRIQKRLETNDGEFQSISEQHKDASVLSIQEYYTTLNTKDVAIELIQSPMTNLPYPPTDDDPSFLVYSELTLVPEEDDIDTPSVMMAMNDALISDPMADIGIRTAAWLDVRLIQRSSSSSDPSSPLTQIRIDIIPSSSTYEMLQRNPNYKLAQSFRKELYPTIQFNSVFAIPTTTTNLYYEYFDELSCVNNPTLCTNDQRNTLVKGKSTIMNKNIFRNLPF